MLGVRRRAIVVGEGEHLDHLLRTLGSVRGGIDYEFVGVVSGEPDGRARPAAARRARRRCARCSTEHPTDELIVTDSDYSERELLQIVEHAHRSGVKVRDRAEDDRAARPARRVRAGPGRCRCSSCGRRSSPAPTGRSSGRSTSSSARLVVVVGLPLWLAIAAAIKLDLARARSSTATRASGSASASSGCSSSGRCTPDAADAAGRARARRTRPRARCSRSATTRG